MLLLSTAGSGWVSRGADAATTGAGTLSLEIGLGVSVAGFAGGATAVCDEPPLLTCREATRAVRAARTLGPCGFWLVGNIGSSTRKINVWCLGT